MYTSAIYVSYIYDLEQNNGGSNISNFRSAKIGNFGGLFLQIVHLFRLGSNGFL